MVKLFTLVTLGLFASLQGADAAGIRVESKDHSDSVTRLNLTQVNEANVQLLRAMFSDVEASAPEFTPIAPGLSAFRIQRDTLVRDLTTEIETAPSTNLEGSSEYWKCFGICNGREQLLCANLATIPVIGPKLAAICVGLIAGKCHLECNHL